MLLADAVNTDVRHTKCTSWAFGALYQPISLIAVIDSLWLYFSGDFGIFICGSGVFGSGAV